MPKIITSPIPRWTGTVTIAEPLTMPQALEIERCRAVEKEGLSKAPSENFKEFRQALNMSGKVPVIKLCVEKWELENFTPDPFPASPKNDIHKLIDWLCREIETVYFGDAFVPNE